MSINQFLKSPAIKSKSTRTITFYTHILTLYRDHCNNENMMVTNPEAIHSFVKMLEDTGRSGNTVQQYVNIVKFYFKKHLGKTLNYTYYISRGERVRRLEKHMERWFNSMEVEQMLQYRGWKRDVLRNSIMVRLLFETGARINEIANITAADFIIDQRMVWIRKSKTLPRAVFYSGLTASMIKTHIDSLIPPTDFHVFANTRDCKYVFTSMLEDLKLKSKNDGRGPHTARHYLATYLYYIGSMDLTDIAVLLGDRTETIREHYLHPTPDMLRPRVDKVFNNSYSWF